MSSFCCPLSEWELTRRVEIGSACLVRSTNNHYLYGRLLGFEPAEQQGGVDHYVVETIERSAKDHKSLKIRRGRIIFTCDNEVATCKVCSDDDICPVLVGSVLTTRSWRRRPMSRRLPVMRTRDRSLHRPKRPRPHDREVEDEQSPPQPIRQQTRSNLSAN